MNIPGTTIDERKLEHYDGLASTWWDESPSSPTALLHKFNALRVPHILQRLETSEQIRLRKLLKTTKKPLKKLNILDVGCGGGILAESLGKLGAAVLGIDPSESLISIADQHLPDDLKEKVHYKCCTAELLGEDHFEQYDVIMLSEVLQHVTDPRIVIEACSKLLKHKGSIIISTPNRSLSSWFVFDVMLEKVLKWVPPGSHSNDKCFRPEELMALLRKNNIGADESSIHGYELNMLNCEMTWGFSKSTAYAYFIQGIKGKIKGQY